jgi:hypothetical protein
MILDSPLLGIELAAALVRLHPKEFDLDKTRGMVGSKGVVQAVRAGVDPRDIRRQWQAGLAEFCRLREQHLLY